MLLFFLLFLSQISTVVGLNKCYQCASEHMIIYWEKYMPLLNGMSGQASNNCKNDSARHEVVTCEGPCFILNATGLDRKGRTVSYGILRDCQTTYWKKKIEVEGEKTCKIHNKRVNGINIKAEYCFCDHHYCNQNEGSPKNELVSYKRKSKQRHSLVRSSSFKSYQLKFSDLFLIMVFLSIVNLYFSSTI
uniref:Protein sleepless n=1 Tax=Strongyloides papillosus TaxID=174720 RepID=A0A0N5BGI4_STREA